MIEKQINILLNFLISLGIKVFELEYNYKPTPSQDIISITFRAIVNFPKPDGIQPLYDLITTYGKELNISDMGIEYKAMDYKETVVDLFIDFSEMSSEQFEKLSGLQRLSGIWKYDYLHTNMLRIGPTLYVLR